MQHAPSCGPPRQRNTHARERRIQPTTLPAEMVAYLNVRCFVLCVAGGPGVPPRAGPHRVGARVRPRPGARLCGWRGLRVWRCLNSAARAADVLQPHSCAPCLQLPLSSCTRLRPPLCASLHPLRCRASPTSTALWATCTTSTAKWATQVGAGGGGLGSGCVGSRAIDGTGIDLFGTGLYLFGECGCLPAPPPRPRCSFSPPYSHQCPCHPAKFAVPPPLAAALGRELRKALEKKAESEREKALAA